MPLSVGCFGPDAAASTAMVTVTMFMRGSKSMERSLRNTFLRLEEEGVRGTLHFNAISNHDRGSTNPRFHAVEGRAVR